VSPEVAVVSGLSLTFAMRAASTMKRRGAGPMKSNGQHHDCSPYLLLMLARTEHL
jgi:hypothetical protein